MHNLTASVFILFAAFAQAAEKELVFSCPLDSEKDITSPAVGSAGVLHNGSFVKGVVGNALQVKSYTLGAVFGFEELRKCFPAGTVEFWARIDKTLDSYANIDPNFFRSYCDNSHIVRMEFSANDGRGMHGLMCATPWATLTTASDWGMSYPYSDILGEGEAFKWHHYAIVWDQNGISGVGKRNAVYIDGKLHLSADSYSASTEDKYKTGNLRLEIGVENSAGSYSIDEFKVYNYAKTTFNIPVSTLPQISNVTAYQHYPWCGKIDIGYDVSGETEGLKAKIVVRDCQNGVSYDVKTCDATPSVESGRHVVVWDAACDGANLSSTNMIATVSLIVPEA